MARSLGIQDRQAPSPKHVPGPTITVERIMVMAPMPEALDKSTPLPGRPHRTTSRLLNRLESLSQAEKGMHNSNSNSDSDSDTPLAIMKIPAITTMALCVAIVVWWCIKSLLH
ncbi:hypothetical protein V2W45_1511658 [Cenococcum geophilum]